MTMALAQAMEEVNYVGRQSMGYNPLAHSAKVLGKRRIIMCIGRLHIWRIKGQGRKRDEGHHWKML